MTQHTPGPWKIDMDCIVTYDGAREIAAVNPDYNPNFMADKRLIAAAPMLLEALETLMVSLEWAEKHQRTTYNGYETAKAAIRAAKGEN